MVEPWRCIPCGQLIYNVEYVDGRPVPTEGAPMPLYIGKEFPMVCKVCWDMYHVLELSDSGYWKKAQEEDVKKQKKLGRGGNYLNS